MRVLTTILYYSYNHYLHPTDEETGLKRAKEADPRLTTDK